MKVSAERSGESWMESNRKWLYPLLEWGGVLVFLSLIVTVFLVVMSYAKSSRVYTEAVELTQANSEVTALLGEPVQAGWWLSGSWHQTGSSGKAELMIPVSGPLNSGRIHASARKCSGRWSFDYLRVEVKGRDEPIDLLGSVQGLKYEI